MTETPKWGSPEFLAAIAEHDAKADPKRKAEGHKYTKPAPKPVRGKFQGSQ